MNLWSDNRNHLLDDFLRDIYMGMIAIVIGVEPGQYVMLVMASQMLQSLQHANVRLHFGRFGDYLRCRHAITACITRLVWGMKRKAKAPWAGIILPLFPLWDVLFGTALFSQEYAETGIRDQLPAPEGCSRDYGRGFWAQQWLGAQTHDRLEKGNALMNIAAVGIAWGAVAAQLHFRMLLLTFIPFSGCAVDLERRHVVWSAGADRLSAAMVCRSQQFSDRR
jgi:hypothetical protein